MLNKQISRKGIDKAKVWIVFFPGVCNRCFAACLENQSDENYMGELFESNYRMKKARPDFH